MLILNTPVQKGESARGLHSRRKLNTRTQRRVMCDQTGDGDGTRITGTVTGCQKGIGGASHVEAYDRRGVAAELQSTARNGVATGLCHSPGPGGIRRMPRGETGVAAGPQWSAARRHRRSAAVRWPLGSRPRARRHPRDVGGAVRGWPLDLGGSAARRHPRSAGVRGGTVDVPKRKRPGV